MRAAVFRRDNPDNPAVVELLLQAGADPEAEDKFAATPLFWAVTFNKLENIKLLLAAGASIDVVNDLGLTLWETAAANNVSGAIIAALNAHQAKLNAAGQQERAPLTQAVLSRDSNKLKALLEQGANPNAIERNGWTPLHLAVLRKEQKLVDLLLAYGANPSLKIKGRTALHYAMQQLVIRSQLSKS